MSQGPQCPLRSLEASTSTVSLSHLRPTLWASIVWTHGFVPFFGCRSRVGSGGPGEPFVLADGHDSLRGRQEIPRRWRRQSPDGAGVGSSISPVELNGARPKVPTLRSISAERPL